MMDSIKQTFHRLIANTPTSIYRYLYNNFNINSRLTGIIGARGVGKTTLILQYIKNHFYNKDNIIYCSADHIYFSNVTLWQFVETLFQEEDIKIFFIDEIHKYPNWQQELKNIYDSFPQIKLIFSGSSSIDLVKGSYDLSRRVRLYHLEGLSFREFLQFEQGLEIEAISFSDLMQNYQKLDSLFATVPKLKSYWRQYLQHGYYPFYREGLEDFYEKIERVVEKTIFEDIANFYNLKTPNLHYFKKILSYLTTIPPGELSIHTLAKNISVDYKTIFHYITILDETKLVRLIYPQAIGNQLLRKPEKFFINNTTLLYALNKTLAVTVNSGMERELFFCQALNGAGLNYFYSKQGDFIVNDITFEIGGKNKNMNKNQFSANFIVKDNCWVSSPKVIPLVCFGFLY